LEEIVLPPFGVADVRHLKPRSLRETLEPQILENARHLAIGQVIPAVRPISDATSLRVARQYEAAPYPRWQTLQHSPPGAMRRSLTRFFAPERLAFMDGDFDVLIAGCGTGQQALQSANAYGPKARLLAMDLSRASLAYASRMAERESLGNVSFIQGDIRCGPPRPRLRCH
jgi:SAM-dependent methyltransferase